MRFVRWLLFAGACIVAAAPFARFARAESAGPLTLSWSAPAECPREDAVLADARTMLGRETGAERAVVARAVVTRSAQGYRVVLTTTRDGTTGERTLDADACPALARATALILVLTIDPSRAATLGTAPPSPPMTGAGSTTPADAGPAETPPPPPPVASTAPSAPAAASSPSPAESAGPAGSAPSPPHFAALAAVALDDGTLPAPSIGAELGVAWLPRPLRLEIAGAIWTSSRATLGGNDPAGGTFQLYSGGARACGAFAASVLEIGPCLAFDLVTVHAEGSGAEISKTGDGTWGIVSAGGDLFWGAVGPFGLRLRVDGFVPTARPEFLVQLPKQDVAVHRPAAVGLRAALGVEARFF